MEKILVDKQEVLDILEKSYISTSEFEEVDNLKGIVCKGDFCEIIKNARDKLSNLISDLENDRIYHNDIKDAVNEVYELLYWDIDLFSDF